MKLNTPLVTLLTGAALGVGVLLASVLWPASTSSAGTSSAGGYGATSPASAAMGCIVNAVSGGTINCPCHGSKYSIVNGSVVTGPAPLPLAAVSITVQGTSIVQA